MRHEKINSAKERYSINEEIQERKQSNKISQTLSALKEQLQKAEKKGDWNQITML